MVSCDSVNYAAGMFKGLFDSIEMNEGVARHMSKARFWIMMGVAVGLVVSFSLVDPLLRKRLPTVARGALLFAGLLAFWFVPTYLWVVRPAVRAWEADVNPPKKSPSDESDED